MDALLRIADVADLLQVSKSTVNRLVRLGDFPAPLRVGQQNRWTREQFDAFIKAGSKQHRLVGRPKGKRGRPAKIGGRCLSRRKLEELQAVQQN